MRIEVGHRLHQRVRTSGKRPASRLRGSIRFGYALATTALAVFVAPPAAQAAIIPCTPTGPTNALAVASPPADLQIGAYESNTCMFMFAEQQNVAIGSGIVDRSPVRGTGTTAATLPEGSNLSSFLIHFDKIGGDPNTPRRLVGSRTFDDPVVGLVYSASTLEDSDLLVGLPDPPHSPGLIFDANSQARSKDVDPADPLTISGANHTVTFDFTTAGFADEVRVLTGTVPPVATVSGTKFNDLDHDGIDDGSGEPGLPNWTIRAYVDANGDGSLNVSETTVAATDTTDSSGAYSLDATSRPGGLCRLRGHKDRLGPVASIARLVRRREHARGGWLPARARRRGDADRA